MFLNSWECRDFGVARLPESPRKSRGYSSPELSQADTLPLSVRVAEDFGNYGLLDRLKFGGCGVKSPLTMQISLALLWLLDT